MTAKRTKLIPAVARLDATPRKLTKAQQLRQQRQIRVKSRDVVYDVVV